MATISLPRQRKFSQSEVPLLRRQEQYFRRLLTFFLFQCSKVAVWDCCSQPKWNFFQTSLLRVFGFHHERMTWLVDWKKKDLQQSWGTGEDASPEHPIVGVVKDIATILILPVLSSSNLVHLERRSPRSVAPGWQWECSWFSSPWQVFYCARWGVPCLQRSVPPGPGPSRSKRTWRRMASRQLRTSSCFFWVSKSSMACLSWLIWPSSNVWGSLCKSQES